MNPYITPSPARPWWRSTPAALGMLGLVALLGTFSFLLGFLAMMAVMVAMWALPPWRWFAKLGATFGAFALLVTGAGLGGQLDSGEAETTAAKSRDLDDKSATATPTPTVPKLPKAADYTGKPLAKAEDQARSAGFVIGRHDAAEDDRAIVMQSGWTVCFQKADTTAKTIDFAAVRTDEPCPEKDGGPLPWPLMPDVVGATYNTALDDLKHAGIDLARIILDDVYLDIETPTAEEAAEDGDEWRVCFQSPDEGAQATSAARIRLDLGRWTDVDSIKRCPGTKDTTYKIPANNPDYDNGGNDGAHDGSPTSGGSSSSSGGSTGGSTGTVHPGSYCSPAGATGISRAGTPMLCGPASDGRNRWHS